MWIYPVIEEADLPGDLAAAEGWSEAAVEDRRTAAALQQLLPTATIRVAADPRLVEVPGDRSLVAAGSPRWAEGLVRHLMGIADGTARMPMDVGALTIVQLLPDRAVLVRLNHGRAVD